MMAMPLTARAKMVPQAVIVIRTLIVLSGIIVEMTTRVTMQLLLAPLVDLMVPVQRRCIVIRVDLAQVVKMVLKGVIVIEPVIVKVRIIAMTANSAWSPVRGLNVILMVFVRVDYSVLPLILVKPLIIVQMDQLTIGVIMILIAQVGTVRL
jgi:hypothetical protein